MPEPDRPTRLPRPPRNPVAHSGFPPEAVLTVGELRRLLVGLGDDVPIGAISMTAGAGSSIGRTEPATVFEVHVTHDPAGPTAVWLWCHRPLLALGERDEFAGLAGTEPTVVAVAHRCGCVAALPIENGLVWLAAPTCEHRSARNEDLYRTMVNERAPIGEPPTRIGEPPGTGPAAVTG